MHDSKASLTSVLIFLVELLVTVAKIKMYVFIFISIIEGLNLTLKLNLGIYRLGLFFSSEFQELNESPRLWEKIRKDDKFDHETKMRSRRALIISSLFRPKFVFIFVSQ